MKDFAEAHGHFSVKAQLFQKNQMCSFVLACRADENNLEFVSFPRTLENFQEKRCQWAFQISIGILHILSGETNQIIAGLGF